jgi:hypothetical protein
MMHGQKSIKLCANWFWICKYSREDGLGEDKGRVQATSLCNRAKKYEACLQTEPRNLSVFINRSADGIIVV